MHCLHSIGNSSFCSSSQAMMPLITGNYVYFEFSITACSNNNTNANTSSNSSLHSKTSSSLQQFSLAIGLSPPDAPLNVMVSGRIY